MTGTSISSVGQLQAKQQLLVSAARLQLIAVIAA